jgi:hypothetical protein
MIQKYISSIAVLALIFIVPLGSWYYLKQGLDYRKDALKTLAPKDSIDLKMDTLNLFNGQTTIVVNQGSDSLNKVISTIGEQFKNTPKFQILYLDSTINSNGKVIPVMYLDSFFQKYKSYHYLLIDNKMKLRNYFGGDQDGIKKLIEHTAIILPRPVEADIEVRK